MTSQHVSSTDKSTRIHRGWSFGELLLSKQCIIVTHHRVQLCLATKRTAARAQAIASTSAMNESKVGFQTLCDVAPLLLSHALVT